MLPWHCFPSQAEKEVALFLKLPLPQILKSLKNVTYPPKIFPVGVLGNRVIGIDFTYQGSKPRSLWYVLLTHHANDLQSKT